MNYKISDKDKKDWQDFISSKDKVSNKDLQKKKINFEKTRTIDLHGFTLEEANKKIQNFILKAFDEKVSKLIIVTGKGIHSDVQKNPYVSKDLSILKYSVPEYIKNTDELMKMIIEIKELLMEGITTTENVQCLFDAVPYEHEGYVMTNDYGTFKLIKRQQFSYANFNNRQFR